MLPATAQETDFSRTHSRWASPQPWPTLPNSSLPGRRPREEEEEKLLFTFRLSTPGTHRLSKGEEMRQRPEG